MLADKAGVLYLSMCCSFTSCTTEKLLELPFQDDFNRDTLGSMYECYGGDWWVQNGMLHSTNARNEACWLKVKLPKNLEISMDAMSKSPAVDIKFEIFGDGQRHQSGYVVILAGWGNSTSIIARLDEHGRERTPNDTRALQQETRKDPLAAASKYAHIKERLSRPVQMQANTSYKLRLRRKDNYIRYYINDELHLEYFDPAPLHGPGHDRFAFNNWASQVQFDNLKIRTLE